MLNRTSDAVVLFRRGVRCFAPGREVLILKSCDDGLNRRYEPLNDQLSTQSRRDIPGSNRVRP
jgi:hypothetical protein